MESVSLNISDDSGIKGNTKNDGLVHFPRQMALLLGHHRPSTQTLLI